MKNEQELAKHLLVHKERNYSVLYILRRSVWRYAFLVGAAVAMLLAFFHADDSSVKLFFIWAFGMLGGALLRDFAWLRQIRTHWPFTKKITDWARVEEIAEGKGSANNTSEDIVAKRAESSR
jgi:hypothetical protein